MSELRNVFACLVHEEPACVLDLVRNLHHLDPNSVVLLYNGGKRRDLLSSVHVQCSKYNAVVYPASRELRWGRLHDFAIDSMRWALDFGHFDTLTVVDSDQLALRAGYSRELCAHLSVRPRLGLLGSSSHLPPGRLVQSPSVLSAVRERRLWRPFLREFADGESSFGQWTFWPSTVFTSDACRALVSLWDRSVALRTIMAQSKILATEEVVLPTLVALLGFEIEESPFRAGCVRFRVSFSLRQLDRALAAPNAFWMHPIPRRYDAPLRKRIRERFDQYGEAH